MTLTWSNKRAIVMNLFSRASTRAALHKEGRFLARFSLWGDRLRDFAVKLPRVFFFSFFVAISSSRFHCKLPFFFDYVLLCAFYSSLVMPARLFEAPWRGSSLFYLLSWSTKRCLRNASQRNGKELNIVAVYDCQQQCRYKKI